MSARHSGGRRWRLGRAGPIVRRVEDNRLADGDAGLGYLGVSRSLSGRAWRERLTPVMRFLLAWAIPSWVMFELPGFTSAALGTAKDSLDALRASNDTSYFKGKDALWVKIVSNGDPGNGAPGGGTSVQVNR